MAISATTIIALAVHYYQVTYYISTSLNSLCTLCKEEHRKDYLFEYLSKIIKLRLGLLLKIRYSLNLFITTLKN
jgi:hypothetical protein